MRIKYVSFFGMMLCSLLVLFACQATTVDQEVTSPSNQEQTDDHESEESNQDASEGGSADQTNPSTKNENQQEDEQTTETELGEQEKQRYQVNPTNFLVYPVDEETGTTGDKEKIVLLTFDDTPTGKATQQILDTLDKHQAKALFFVNGHYAKPNLELLLEIKERGHLIGNHTWWHKNVRQLSPEKVREEIVGLSDFLEEHLGERPHYFRPPFGQNSDVSLQVVKEEGMQTMNWSLGSLDWQYNSSEAIANQVIENIFSGANILFHDKQTTADALDTILTELEKQGYTFVLPTEVILPQDK